MQLIQSLSKIRRTAIEKYAYFLIILSKNKQNVCLVGMIRAGHFKLLRALLLYEKELKNRYFNCWKWNGGCYSRYSVRSGWFSKYHN